MNIEEVDFLRSCTPDEECFQKLQHYVKENQRYRDLSDVSIDGVVITKNGVVVDINLALSEIFGYSHEEVLRLGILDFATPQSAQIAMHNIRDGITEPYEIEAVHKNGHTFPIEVAGQTLEYDGDQFRITIVRDITERKCNERQLQSSQANLLALIENTRDSIWSVDLEYRLITYNSVFKDHFFKAYGIYPKEGDAIKDILPQEIFEHWMPIYSRAFNGEQFTTENETEYEGRRYYTEVSLNPIISNGKITGIATYSRDITERKESELALKESQANTNTLLENIDASFWSVNTNYQVLILNTIYSNIYYREYDVKLEIGDSAFKGLTAANSAYWKKLYTRCFAGENIDFDAEYEFKGELQYYHVTLSPIINDGMITGAACSSRDITDRKRTEERLREHSVLLDIANEAIIVKDLDSRITFWNKAAERMYGWSAKEAIGRKITDLLYNKETIRSFEEARSELLFSGQWSGELKERNRNGKEVTTYSRCTLVFDTNGKPKSVLTINTDITEQKSLQQQFYHSQRMESLGALASGIAHDLNNVLTPILLSVEILRIKYPEDKNSRMLETIEVSAKRGADIVRQVLMFGRGISGERTSVLLMDSIREIAMIARKTFPKSIEFYVSVSNSVQPILGDSTQIQQILMNLCVNARDAMPQGGELRIELDSKIPPNALFATTPEARSMEYTVLKVSDTGTGIPLEIIDRIFDPFFTTKEIGSGTGLGLSTVNAIVKSHNGFLKVFNNPDKGVSFEIWFPAYYAKDHEITPKEASEIIISGKGKTILIVDDEPLILQLISYSFEKFGFTILTANNGGQALLIYKENPQIELIITDVNMPGMDGLALVGELMAIKPSLRFIVMTGLPINNRMDEMRTIGVSSFLSKPFKTQILLKAIGNAFNPEVTTTSM